MNRARVGKGHSHGSSESTGAGGFRQGRAWGERPGSPSEADWRGTGERSGTLTYKGEALPLISRWVPGLSDEYYGFHKRVESGAE